MRSPALERSTTGDTMNGAVVVGFIFIAMSGAVMGWIGHIIYRWIIG